MGQIYTLQEQSDDGPPRHALPVRSVSYRVEPPPDRIIEFQLTVQNRLDRPLTILSTRSRCRLNNVTVAKGEFSDMFFSMNGFRAIAPQEEGRVDLRVPLSREALERIEGRRADGDLAYRVQCGLLTAAVLETEPPSLGVPWRTYATTDPSDTELAGEIARSKWIDYLKQMEWEETLIIELPARRLRGRSPKALERYEEALQLHRQGNYRKALAACRDAFEALAWRHTEKGAKKPDMKALRQFFDEGEKGDYLDATLTSFQDFLHLGRHEQSVEKGIEVTRADSLMALHLTAGILRYLES